MHNSPAIGILFKLLNCLIFPTLSILMLHITSNNSFWLAFFLQVFFGSCISLFIIFLMKKNISYQLTSKDILYYSLRAIVNILALKLWITALLSLGINEATAISYTGPLWAAIMARFFLKEKLHKLIVLIIFINLIGMIIIIQPKLSLSSISNLTFALGAIILWSLYEVICKIQTNNQHFMIQTFIFMVFSSIFLLPNAIIEWQTISIKDYGLILLSASLAVANITVIFIAYSFAPITSLAPFSYARLIFTVIITTILMDQNYEINSFIGAIIILASNSYLFLKSKTHLRG